MPQRASQRKFGKAWNYTWLTKGTEARGNMKQIYVEEKSVKRTFVSKKPEEKASRRTRKKLLICLRMSV